MTAAIFGILGVIVGGVLQGIVQVVLASRHERTEARVAARLLMLELAEATMVLRHSLDEGSWKWVLGSENPLSQSIWTDHRALLARRLGSEEWVDLAIAQLGVEKLRDWALAAEDPWLLSRPARKNIEAALEAIGQASTMLRHLGEVPVQAPREEPQD